MKLLWPKTVLICLEATNRESGDERNAHTERLYDCSTDSIRLYDYSSLWTPKNRKNSKSVRFEFVLDRWATLFLLNASSARIGYN